MSQVMMMMMVIMMIMMMMMSQHAMNIGCYTINLGTEQGQRIHRSVKGF